MMSLNIYIKVKLLKQLELIDIPTKIIDKNSKGIVKVIKDLKKLTISLQNQ